MRPSDDPYKKYWWLILLSFGLTAAWLLAPMMEKPIGSTRVDVGGELADPGASGEASLDGSDNPNGAPGSTIDLSMEALARPKKADGTPMSSLYQAPDEPQAPAPASTAGAKAPGGTLVDALKKVAKSDPSGWGGQAPRKGFKAPRLGGSMPSLPSGGGVSGAYSAKLGGSGAFGARNADVGFESARGLSGSAGDLPEARGARGALARASAQAKEALRATSKDQQVSGLSALFDGRSAKGGSAIGGDGGEAIGQGGIYGSLDAAPKNLKLNDPNLDLKEITPPPAAVANTRDNRSEELKRQMAMMVVTTLVGGIIGGTVGNAITGLAPALMSANRTDREGAVSGAPPS